MTFNSNEERRYIVYTLVLQMALATMVLVSGPIPNVQGFDFATDEWDQTKYASPVDQWVAELPNTPTAPMDVNDIHSVDDLSTYIRQNNATVDIQNNNLNITFTH